MGNRYILCKKKKKILQREEIIQRKTVQPPGKPTLFSLDATTDFDDDEAPPLAEKVTQKKIITSSDQGSKGKQRPRQAQSGEAKQRPRRAQSGEAGQR